MKKVILLGGEYVDAGASMKEQRFKQPKQPNHENRTRSIELLLLIVGVIGSINPSASDGS